MEILRNDSHTIVKICERLTGKAVNDMLATVRAEKEQGSQNIVIDFGGTDFISSSGIGSLVSLTKEFKTKGASLTLCNLCDDIRMLFEETGLDMIFNIQTAAGIDTAKIDIFETAVDIRLDIAQETDGDICVFHMSGVMNHPLGSRFFKHQCLLAMAHCRKILLDFENLTFFDSLSVSVILNMNKLLKETGGSLRLCGANYIVDDLFTTLNIGQIIPIFDTVAAAKTDWN